MRSIVGPLVLSTLLLAGCGQPSNDPPFSLGGDAPRVEFEVAESYDQLVVGDRTDESADWSRIEIRIVSSGFAMPLFMGQDAEGGYQNEIAYTSGLELTGSFVRVTDVSESMTDTPLEFIEFCAEGQFSELDLEVQDGPTDEPIGTYRLANVAACSI